MYVGAYFRIPQFDFLGHLIYVGILFFDRETSMFGPYVGITGFTKRSEVEALLSVVPVEQIPNKRLLMVGALASAKTLRGETNKYPNRYPAIADIAKIFIPDRNRAINLVHYNTDEPDRLGVQLVQVASTYADEVGYSFDGFQLNAAWPHPDQIVQLFGQFAELAIVLQIGRRAFEMVGNDPNKLACRVLDYAGVIDYVLLDPSGGKGRPFDPECARGYLRALRDQNLGSMDIGFGVAGGLSPTTLNLIEPLLEEFSDFSIDAEGRLRTIEDHLDLNVACEYLVEAQKLFGGRSL